MKEANVKRAMAALGLEHRIVGLKFLDFKEDYEAKDLPGPEKFGPLCYQVRTAMDGRHFKCKEEDVSCDYARYAIGLTKPDPTIVWGRSYHHCGLYETNAIAREITAAMKFIDQEIYGIEIGPLETMDDADVVIIAAYAETVMRIMKSYAYKYGEPKHLCFYGNQAMCSDMVAKPYTNNDINVSLMCKGMRSRGRFDRGELSVAFPINMFDNIVDGIVKTINPVNTLVEKRAIIERLESPEEMGIEFDMNYAYGLGLKEYDGRVCEIRAKNK